MQQANKYERGQALVIIVFAIIGLVGMTGLVIDGGIAYSEKQRAQNAVDSAALAAALAHIRGNDYNSAAQNSVAINGFDIGQAANGLQVNHPPADGDFAGNDEYIQVILTTQTQTTFAGLLGVENLTNRVEAITRVTKSTSPAPYYGEAVVALSPDDRGSLRSHGNNGIEVLGGSVFTNSNDSAAFVQEGNSSLTAPLGVNVVGGVKLDGSITTDTTITVGVDAKEYPPLSLPPEPKCEDTDGNPINAEVYGNVMTPGNWPTAKNIHTFPPSGVTFLQPGIYCVDTTFMLNNFETLTGHEVLIYMRSGNIHWNGAAVQVNLTPPSSGPYEGLLIYMPMENDEGIIFNGNAESTISGTVFAPASDIQINGTGSTESYKSQFIGYTVDLIGNARATVNYTAEGKYKFPKPTVIQFIK